MSLNTMTDLNEMTLDDVADLVSFDNPQDGLHVFGIPAAGIESYKDKQQNVCQRVYFIMQLRKTIEQANANDPAAAIGSIHKNTFGGDAKGQEYFKAFVQKLLPGQDLKGLTIAGICKAIRDVYTEQANLQAASRITTKDGFDNVRLSKLSAVAVVGMPEGIGPVDYKPTTAE